MVDDVSEVLFVVSPGFLAGGYFESDREPLAVPDRRSRSSFPISISTCRKPDACRYFFLRYFGESAPLFEFGHFPAVRWPGFLARGLTTVAIPVVRHRW